MVKVLRYKLEGRWFDFFRLHYGPGVDLTSWNPLGTCGPDSSVGIATNYVLDGSGSIRGGDEILRPSRPALGPTQPPVQWVPGLSRG